MGKAGFGHRGLGAAPRRPGGHQQADGALRFRFAGPGADVDTLRRALTELFGGQVMDVREGGFDGDKVVQYTSELDGARP